MFLPAPLKPGDAVALVAPSSPVTHHVHIKTAVNFFTTIGLQPQVYDSCTKQRGHLAGEDAHRATDIMKAFLDSDIKGIFCVRGGNGAARVLDYLNFDVMKKNPKPFYGYSDITALHTAINKLAGLATFHTPLACEANFKDADELTLDLFKRFIFEPYSPTVIQMPYTPTTLISGRATGEIIGGNLSCMSALMGTKYEVDTADKIFFIEEVGTNLPRCDRMLRGLKMAGKFDKAAAVIFGDFTNCEKPEFSLSLEDILLDLNIQVPAVHNFPCGHILPTVSLPFGVKCRLDAGAIRLEIIC